jgi:MSHA biogenesis protein MshO
MHPIHRDAMTRARGFTLMEMVIVIVVLGIIAGMASTFLRSPLQGYFDSISRARLVDIADTALRRIGRDLQAALPNSVRTVTVGSVQYLEFIPTVGGGRYGAERSSTGTGTPLSFQSSNSSFDILTPAMVVPASSYIVIFNLGIPGADAYEGSSSAANVMRPATPNATASQTIAIDAANRAAFPFESPSHRFQLVTQPVTYVCDKIAKTLSRYASYGFNPTQIAPGGTPALIASAVSDCNFQYSASNLAGRAGLVTLYLQLDINNERINLAQEVHVSNVP